MKKMLISLLLASFVFAVPAFGDSNMSNGKMMSKTKAQMQAKSWKLYGKKFKMKIKSLNLTQQQKMQMKQIVKKYMADKKMLCDKMMENYGKLAQLRGSNYDASQVQDVADSQGDLFSQKIQLKAKMRNDIYNLFTDQQKQKFEKMMMKKSH